MKQSYFVIGPESSGTRMITNALIKSSGFFGNPDDWQAIDATGFHEQPNNIVFRRSLPHGGVWFDLKGLIHHMEAEGYSVTVIAMDRADEYLVTSQRMHGHADTEKQARENIKKARAMIDELTVINVNYGAFVTDKNIRIAFFDSLGLKHPDMKFYNGNAKY